jgi:hypothetical protein
MKRKIYALIFVGALLFLAFNSLAEIKNPTKYRVIDTTSERYQLYGIKGMGIGNIIFSSQELPKGEEAGYTDIRDKFIFVDDTSIHCRVYYPGTFESMIEKVESETGYEFITKHALLEVTDHAGGPFPLRATMTFTTPISDIADWDQERFDLLPYEGGPDQDFNMVNLSDDYYKPGITYTVSIWVDLRFKTGVNLLTGETLWVDYVIAYGKFDYIGK